MRTAIPVHIVREDGVAACPSAAHPAFTSWDSWDKGDNRRRMKTKVEPILVVHHLDDRNRVISARNSLSRLLLPVLDLSYSKASETNSRVARGRLNSSVVELGNSGAGGGRKRQRRPTKLNNQSWAHPPPVRSHAGAAAVYRPVYGLDDLVPPGAGACDRTDHGNQQGVGRVLEESRRVR